MRKFYTTLFAAFLSLPVVSMAQQLPNSGFEDGWGNCTPWNANNNTKTTGTTPGSWTISQVSGTYSSLSFMNGLGSTVVGEQVEGYKSNAAVNLHNTPNSIATSVYVPGYITLGTTWSTSVSNSKNDGGAFGGIEFAYRPDAMTFMYKRSLGAEYDSIQPATVVAYLWKGTYSQASVPGSIVTTGNPKTVTMVNRDRNILGMTTSRGGDVTKSDDAELVAVINTLLYDLAADWTATTFDFEYKSSNTPAMCNVILASNDYFNENTSVLQNGNTLTVDDVILLYYSRLSDVKLGGESVEGFDSQKYEYEVEELPALTGVEYTTLGASGSATASAEINDDTLTITVTNAQGNDADGKNTHVYTFKKKANSGVDFVAADSNAAVEYYNLQGVKVSANDLVAGIYIVRQGNSVKKIVVK